MWLVSKGGSGVEVQVVVVDSNLVLALLHAPEDESDATEKESTANATNDSTNDLLVGLTKAVSASAVSLLCAWGLGNLDLASGNGYRARTGLGDLRELAIAQG